MNDMNETLAEIRRRGDQRIRARKRMRNRITALCVPLVLCVAAVLAMPEIAHPTYVAKPVETMIPTNLETDPPVETEFSTLEPAPVLFTVSGKNVNRSYTDMETMVKLQNILDSITVSGQGAVYTTDKSAAGTQTLEREHEDFLLVTFLEADQIRVLELYETSVYIPSEKIGYGISTAQYHALRQLLELD